VPFRN